MNVRQTVYLDTSVINFLFADDAPEKKEITLDLFDNFIKTTIYQTYISDYVVAEINQTTDNGRRRKLLQVIVDYSIDLLDLSDAIAIESLADIYIHHGVIPHKKRVDALHAACSVINKIDYLVSWNYKHLANVTRERKILSINYSLGYVHPLRIITPTELIDYGI